MQQNQVACTHKSQLLGMYLPTIIVPKEFQSLLVSPVGIVFRSPCPFGSRCLRLMSVHSTQSRLFSKILKVFSTMFIYLRLFPHVLYLIRCVLYFGVQMISKLQYFCPHNQNVLYLTRDVLETCLRGDRRSGNLVGKDLCCGNNLFLCN